jgi:hypothetical protein
MTEKDVLSHWGPCKICGNYINLNEEGVCRTCVLYPKPNVGTRQVEWRLSKMKKEDDKE